MTSTRAVVGRCSHTISERWHFKRGMVCPRRTEVREDGQADAGRHGCTASLVSVTYALSRNQLDSSVFDFSTLSSVRACCVCICAGRTLLAPPCFCFSRTLHCSE